MLLRRRLEKLERARQMSPAPAGILDTAALMASIIEKAEAAASGKFGPPVDLPPEMAIHRERLIARVTRRQLTRV